MAEGVGRFVRTPCTRDEAASATDVSLAREDGVEENEDPQLLESSSAARDCSNWSAAASSASSDGVVAAEWRQCSRVADSRSRSRERCGGG